MPLSLPTRPRRPALLPVVDEPLGSSGFDSERPRQDHRIRRWSLNAFLVLMVVIGVWRTFGLPLVQAVSRPAPPAAGPVAIAPAAAAQLAVDFTADYFSYDPSNPRVRAAALARWTGESADQVPGWSGNTQLRADLVTAGPQVAHGADVAVVATTARVVPASLPGGAAVPSGGQKAGGVRSADPGPAAAPWSSGTAEWLPLEVVVARSGGALHVTGAVFGGDAPVAVAAPGTQDDSTLTADTQGLPRDLLTAVASGQLGYVTAPGVHLAGLGGAVTVSDLSGWTVSAAGGSSRYAVVDATWGLAGTDLQIKQRYSLRITQTAGRWLLGSYGPRLED